MEYKIKDIVKFQKGFAFKSCDYKEKGIKIVKVSNLNGDIYNDSQYVYVDKTEKDLYRKYELKENDVVINTVGSWENNPNSVVGKVSIIPKYLNNELLNQNAVILRSKDDICLQKYLGYMLKSNRFKNYIVSSAQGSANQASITLNDIGAYKVNIPNSNIQNKIVKILDCIEKKIELNNQINDNLQDFARLLFENKFQEKKCNAKLKELVSLKKDTIKISTKNLDLGYYPIDILPMNYLVTKTAKPNDEAKSSLIGFSKYDILLGSMRVYFHRVCLAGNDGITRNTTFVFVPKIKEYLYYALLLIDKEDFINYASKTSKGTTMPYAVWEALAKYDIYLPTIEELEEFNKALYPLFEKMIYNEKENETLSQLRDTLLPKLMNGEIDLNSIEI